MRLSARPQKTVIAKVLDAKSAASKKEFPKNTSTFCSTVRLLPTFNEGMHKAKKKNWQPNH
jgi:hypothetical protein